MAEARPCEKPASGLTDSAFERSGPYQLRLPAGDHLLSFLRGPIRDGRTPLLVTLDDQVLLHTQLVGEGLSDRGTSHLAAASQIDYGPETFPPGHTA